MQIIYKPAEQMNTNQKEEENHHFANIVSEWAQNTSLQGVPLIERSTRWYNKLFWTVIFVIATGFFIAHSYYIVDLYLSFQTNTAVTIENGHIPFPSVTLCNINPIKLSDVSSYGSEKLLQLLKDVQPFNSYGQMPGANSPANSETSSVSSETTTTAFPETTTTASPETTSQQSNRDESVSDTSYYSYYYSPYDYYYSPYDYWSYTGQADYMSYANPIDWHQFIGDYAYLLTDADTSTKIKLNIALKTVLSKASSKTRTKMGEKLPTMMMSCSFDGKTCSASNFSKTLDMKYGNCFTFNSPQVRNSSLISKRSGTRFGINMVLFIGDINYITGFHLGRGVRLHIHEYNSMPFVEDFGISIAPGRHAYVSIKAVKQVRLGGKYGPCGDGGLFKAYYENKYNYTLTACSDTCLDRSIANICKCFRETQLQYYSKNHLTNLKPCASRSELDCVVDLNTQFIERILNCGCKQACESTDYEETITYDAWPEADMWFSLVDAVCKQDAIYMCAYFRSISKADHEKILRKNFLKLQLYYKDLNLELIQQEPAYAPAQFASDLGGAVGLWIGVTFITVFEILQLICQLMTFCCRHRKRADRVMYPTNIKLDDISIRPSDGYRYNRGNAGDINPGQVHSANNSHTFPRVKGYRYGIDRNVTNM